MPDLPTTGPLDPDLLGRYLAGECSEAESAVVRRHLMANPDAARMLERFLERLDGADGRPAPPDARASWDEVRRRMRDEGGAHSPVAEPPGRAEGRAVAPDAPRPWWSRWRVAAGAAAAAAVVAVAAFAGARDRGAGADEARHYVTGAGERAELRLADGSRVVMAPGSRLRVAADFGRERRDVMLEGEAYFDVAHDERRPFTVFAGNASARDLGTAFSVRGYPEDGAVRVAVREGVVALSGVGRLAAGDVGRLARDGRASVERGADLEPLLGWMEGRLTYADAPLALVLEDVRRWHGVEVALGDPALGALPFTGTLTELGSRDAVELVAATLGLRVRQDGGRLLLDATPDRTPRPAAAAPGARVPPDSGSP